MTNNYKVCCANSEKQFTIPQELFLRTHRIDTRREHLKHRLKASTAAELSRIEFYAMIDNT